MDEAQITANISNATSKPFAGVWLSDYTYRSVAKEGDLNQQHYMHILQDGDTIVAETIPELNDSYRVMRLNIDGRVATGSWQQINAPEGDYEGRAYHGATQLIIAEDGKSMEGKWVGFGRTMEVKTGPITMRYVAADVKDLPKVQPAAS